MSISKGSFVLSKQVDLLFRNVRIGQISSIVNASFLVWVASQLGQSGGLVYWWVASVLIAILRIRLASQYFACDLQNRAQEAANWRKRALIGAGISGVIWGFGALLLMLGKTNTLQLFTAFVMAGMIAGAVPVLAADRLAFRVYAGPIILAVGIGSLGSDPLHIAFTVMTVLFLFIAIRSADHFHDALHETFRLEREKGSLVTDLQAAKSLAETSDRAKTEFLANVSHELRTPMNGILGMADLLDMEDLTADQRSYLKPLRSSAKDLLHLINQIIELSALESGQIKVIPSAFAMPDLLDSLLNKETREAKIKGLDLKLENDPDLPEVLIGDLERLRQVLLNLVGNAIKFTEHGQILVTVKVVEKIAGKIALAFSISDTGPGIAPEKLKHLLTSLFVQADGSVVRRHSGTGIGLPIARKLIELLGGKLEVASKVGVGSTFSFTLPFEVPAD